VQSQDLMMTNDCSSGSERKSYPVQAGKEKTQVSMCICNWWSHLILGTTNSAHFLQLVSQQTKINKWQVPRSNNQDPSRMLQLDADGNQLLPLHTFFSY